MAAALLGGAALGPVFDRLLKVVVDFGVNIATFRSEFLSLKQTLIYIKPVFDDIERLSKALDGRDEEIDMFKKQLMKGEDLVLKCSKIKSYDPLKWNYSRKLTKLENSLMKVCQIDGIFQLLRDSKSTRVNVIENRNILEEIHSMLRNVSLTRSGSSIVFTNSSGSSGWMNGSSLGFSGLSNMPQVSDSMVGFEVPLHELKQKLKLLQEKDQVLVLSAPPIISCTNTPHGTTLR
ncbi:protein DA1-related 5-like [Solanum tuberosum]|uniref:protein DA1-related 5-like n=1 Tax=Solanum tuberosum TaxID=4113 RepID=UPI00073A2C6D|nr:PREDICTED: protein DA1-related 5-like [Solanum tuberosum]